MQACHEGFEHEQTTKIWSRRCTLLASQESKWDKWSRHVNEDDSYKDFGTFGQFTVVQLLVKLFNVDTLMLWT